jgi:hypothetical protein
MGRSTYYSNVDIIYEVRSVISVLFATYLVEVHEVCVIAQYFGQVIYAIKLFCKLCASGNIVSTWKKCAL